MRYFGADNVSTTLQTTCIQRVNHTADNVVPHSSSQTDCVLATVYNVQTTCQPHCRQRVNHTADNLYAL